MQPQENDLKEQEKSGVYSYRKPFWLKRPKAFSGKYREIVALLETHRLQTVCRNARCPNRSECYACGTATFLVMGRICTRRCRFCSVTKGTPEPLDWDEIKRLLRAARAMNLRHVVITSVSRDDLHDGGASFFAETVRALRRDLPGATIEILVPDFKGDTKALEVVVDTRPDIFNHNVETVPSLYADIRPQADYTRSLSVLQYAARKGVVTKSGLMVGLGEQSQEVFRVLDDLKSSGCSIVTIGQYLQPSKQQIRVKSYITPQEFEEYALYGRKAGIAEVIAGPFVRSSYHAAEVMEGMGITMIKTQNPDFVFYSGRQ